MKFYSLLAIFLTYASAATTPATLACDKVDPTYKDICTSLGDSAQPILEKVAKCETSCGEDNKCKQNCYSDAFSKLPIGKSVENIAKCAGETDPSKIASCAGITVKQANDFANCIKKAGDDAIQVALCSTELLTPSKEEDTAKTSDKKGQSSSSTLTSVSSLALLSTIALIGLN